MHNKFNVHVTYLTEIEFQTKVTQKFVNEALMKSLNTNDIFW